MKDLRAAFLRLALGGAPKNNVAPRTRNTDGVTRRAKGLEGLGRVACLFERTHG